MTQRKKKILNAIAQRAHEVAPPGSTILLFGSQARGDARPDSDWDILILLDKDKITDEDHDNISYSLFDLGLTYKELFNTILFTKNDWKDNRIAPFRINVEEDAIEL